MEALAVKAEERFGPERVIAAHTLTDAIETATALVDESGNERVGGVGMGGVGMGGVGMVITGSVFTAGAARTLFGKYPA